MELFAEYVESLADYYDACLDLYGIDDPRTIQAYFDFDCAATVLFDWGR